ncbi:MAG: methylmalonyl-CoA mutase [Polyangiaceae bacterium]|nr:methylmalonyl-CoA mutase [Polyangiaceae bacterium]
MVNPPHNPHAEWEAQALSELDGKPPASLETTTREQIVVKPLYTAADVGGTNPEQLFPGVFPYVRGPYATMHVGKPWTIRQYAGFSTAEASNEFYKQALAGGQRGLSVAFDLATHRGYDSDHPRVIGDVGKAGVAIDSVEDMKALFQDIDLAKISVSMTMNGAVLPVLAAFIVAAEESGVEATKLRGTIQNDILKEFMVRNTYIYPPEPSLRIVADVIDYVSREMPNFNSISISGYHMHEAGAPADLELAFTLADGIEYVRTALSKGLGVDEFAPRLSFFFAVGMDLFMEVAKLRAARKIWATEMERLFQPKDPRSLLLRTHCQTSGVSLAQRDPLNNIVRTTVEALAAVLGGTQSLHTNGYDEAVSLPTDTAARIARNTQLILQHETGITRTADPLGGSYLVEALTEGLVQRAKVVMAEVEALGGMRVAVQQGFPKQMIERAATLRQGQIDRGEEVVIGVNRYVASEAEPVEVRVIDNEAVRATQVQRLRQLKLARNAEAVQKALLALTDAARSGAANLLKLSVQAMRVRATVGEVSLALEQVYGRYEAHIPTVKGVYGGPLFKDPEWQGLRSRVSEFALAEGRQPRILIVKLGQDGHDRGARLMAAGLADLGFDVDVGPLFSTPGEAAAQAVDNDVHVVGVSTQAGAHLTLVSELLSELSSRGASNIAVVCGGIIPPADHSVLLSRGVKAIFGPGARVAEAASTILNALGAK